MTASACKLFGVVLLTICGSTPLAGQDPAPARSGEPQLKLSSEEWNFGEVWQGQPLKGEIIFTNVGDAPLEILDITTSCGCTLATRPKSPLAPGESGTMIIGYTSEKRPGRAQQTVTVKTNDLTRPTVSIRVTGEVKPAYTMEPRDGLVFGQLFQKSGESRRVVITNKYTEPLLLSLKPNQDLGPFVVELKPIEVGQKYELIATTKPPLPVGRHQAQVELLTNLEFLPHIDATLYGFVQPPVTVRPEKLFWPRNYPTEMKRVLRVAHAPDHPIEVTEVRSNYPEIKVEVEKPSEGKAPQREGTQISVTLPPGDRLPADAQPVIEIMTTSPDPAYQKLVVPIQVVGSDRSPGKQADGTGPNQVVRPQPAPNRQED